MQAFVVFGRSDSWILFCYDIVVSASDFRMFGWDIGESSARGWRGLLITVFFP